MLQNTLKQLKKKDRTKLLKQLSADLPSGCNVSTRNPAITSDMLKRITYIRNNADKLNPTELNEALKMLGFPMIDSWNPTIIDEQRRLLCSYLNEKTATGNPITLNIIGNLTPEVTDLKVSMSPIQSGSGEPSPTNIRPISGRTEASVTRTAGEDVETKTHEYSETIYGGVDDFVNGKLTIDSVYIDLGELTWIKMSGYFQASFTDSVARPITGNTPFDGYCSNYKVSYLNDSSDSIITMGTSANIVYIRDNSKNDLTSEQFTSAMSGVQLVCKLKTPTTIEITPEEITLLKGENVVSTDGDSIELKYKLSLT